MNMIEKLNAFGADTAEGISRCCGSEALYLRLVKMIPEEKGFDDLKNAIKANDTDAAFAAAHTLKGVLGNLSLSPMYEIASEMTEQLRAHEQTDYTPMLQALLNMKEELALITKE